MHGIETFMTSDSLTSETQSGTDVFTLFKRFLGLHSYIYLLLFAMCVSTQFSLSDLLSSVFQMEVKMEIRLPLLWFL